MKIRLGLQLLVVFMLAACSSLGDFARSQQEEEQQLRLQYEERLKTITGSQPLNFKSLIADIYVENDYALLWADKEIQESFLHQYAALVASGISKNSARLLQNVSDTDPEQRLLYDVLLTDAFLDYLYYVDNLVNNAQTWLYSLNAYQGKEPSQTRISQWLTTVKNGAGLEFIQGLNGTNEHYQQTVAALATAGDERQNLAINAQRLRILPEFHNGIFVNIPSYQLQYYRDGQIALTSRVIVGRSDRKTPVMYSKLSNVVVNPPWNAPTRLTNEDIIPKVRKDPSYLARNGYTILDGRGNAVSADSIDWSSVPAKFPYRLRQDPTNSALGRYKFNMPSSDAIYLHDTPSRGLFAKQMRALSSGCVRVEKSDELATILLKEAGWSEQRKASVLKSYKTTSANIQSDNPVYLYYVTAWVEDGQVKQVKDIYGYDKNNHINNINWQTVEKYL